MLHKPRLKTFLSVFPIADTVWGLRGGPEELWRLKISSLDGMKTFCSLLPHLNGQQSWEAIVRAAANGSESTAAVETMLSELQSAGLIEESDPHGLTPAEVDRFAPQLAFFSRFTSEGGAKYQALLKESRVAVFGTGELARRVCDQLAGSGIGEVTFLRYDENENGNGDDVKGHEASADAASRVIVRRASASAPWPDGDQALPNLFIGAVQQHDPVALEAMDVLSKRRKIPWLLVRATDVHEACIGPLFIPGETASYVSLEARLRSNMPHHPEYQSFDRHVRAQPRESRSAGGLYATFDCAASIATIEAIKLLTGILPLALAGKFLSVNLVSWETDLHEVLRVPRLEMESDEDPVFPWREAPYAVNESRRG